MRILNLHIENFLGFREVDLQLPEGPAFIIGENRDQGTQGSNGSGKTALTQAITWCLFDVLRPGLVKDEVIHWGGDYALVSVEIEHEGKLIKMTRTRKHPELGNGSVLQVDGVDRTQHKDADTIDKLGQLIGVSKKAFMKAAISEDAVANPPFVSLTPAPMLAVVTEMLELERFDVYTKTCSELLRKAKQENETLLVKLNSAMDKLDTLRDKIVEYEADIEVFEIQKEADTTVRREKVAALEGERAVLQDKIDSYASTVAEYNATSKSIIKESERKRGALDELRTLEIYEATRAVASWKQKEAVESAKVSDTQAKIDNLTNEHSDCDYCGSPLEGSKHTMAKLDEFKAELEDKTHKLTELQANRLYAEAELKKAKAKEADLVRWLAAAEEEIEHIEQLKSQVDACNNLRVEMNLLDSKILAANDALLDVGLRSVNSVKKHLDAANADLITAKSAVKELKAEIKASDTSIKALDVLVKCFKKIKHGIMNGFTSKLLVQINHNLNRFTEGDFHASLEMGKDGLTLRFRNSDALGFRPYAVFSSGEQIRIMKAVQVALCQVSGATIMIEDEGFSKLDPAGVPTLIDFMLDCGMSNLLFVSHASTVSDYLRDYPTIKVTKENDVATVELID